MYISFVGNKSTTAYQYLAQHFNLYGYPTCWFDDGYRVLVGGGGGVQTSIQTRIGASGKAPVHKLSMTLTANYLGGTQYQLDLSVTNNQYLRP